MTFHPPARLAAMLALPLLALGCGRDKDWTYKSQVSIDLYEKGLYADALLPAKEALDLALKEFGEDDVLTVYSLDHMGKVYLRMGRLQDAEPYLERTVRINKKILEPDSPKQAYYLGNLAELRMQQERYDEAERLYGDALKLTRRAWGELNNKSAGIQARMAVLYKNWGLHERAEPLLRRVGAILDRIDAPDEAVAADVESAWCAVLLESGRTGAAREHCERAYGERERFLPPGHIDLADAMGGLGLLYVRRGRLEQAEKLLSRAFEAYKKHPGADRHGHLAASLAMAELEAARGRTEAAGELFNETVPRFENSYAAIKAMVRTARFQQRAGNLALAETLYRSAMVKYDDSPKADEADRDKIFAGLIEVSLARKEYAVAERLLERALPDEADVGGGYHGALSEAVYEMSRSFLERGRVGQARRLAGRLKWMVAAGSLPEDPLRRTNFDAVAELYAAVGDHRSAKELRRRAWEERRRAAM